MTKRLYKLPEQGQLTGVAAGLADYFNIDPTIVRVLFVLAAFFTEGLAVLAYLLLAVILPARGKSATDFGERVSQVFEGGSGSNLRNWLGLGLIVLGGWYLVNYLWPGLVAISWGALWPIVLILVGIVILTRGRR